MIRLHKNAKNLAKNVFSPPMSSILLSVELSASQLYESKDKMCEDPTVNTQQMMCTKALRPSVWAILLFTDQHIPVIVGLGNTAEKPIMMVWFHISRYR